jgi:hypothetical protein
VLVPLQCSLRERCDLQRSAAQRFSMPLPSAFPRALSFESPMRPWPFFAPLAIESLLHLTILIACCIAAVFPFSRASTSGPTPGHTLVQETLAHLNRDSSTV